MTNLVRGTVLGHPVEHSLSPALYREAFRANDINGNYEALDCTVDQLETTLKQLWNNNVQALSVTMPLKEQIIPFMTEMDDTAQVLGAVNCVSRTEAGWVGHNTDGDGCCDALIEQGHAQIEGKTAVVLGAGGTAKSVCLALVRRGAHVVVVNRTRERAVQLVERISHACGDNSHISVGELDHIARAHVVVNTTSVGMNSSESPVPSGVLHSQLVVLDAVYQPLKTQLLTDAQQVGATIVDGLWMLVQQARHQCVYQFGWKPDAQPLRDAAERELAARRK